MSPRPNVLALASLVIFALPAVADAQLGGLVQRARERAEREAARRVAGEAANQATSQAQQQACGAQPTFDQVILELNGDNVGRFIRGLEAIRTAGERNGRNRLAARVETDRARLQELEQDPSVYEAENSMREYNSCRQQAFGEIVGQRIQQQGGILSTNYMRAMREHQERIQAAQQRGDTAAARRMQDSTFDVLNQVAAPTAADSAAVQTRCGRPPRASRRVAERDSLRTVVREMSDSVRVLDEDAEDAVRAASGMTARQFAMARERVQMFLGGAPCGFTQAERSALTARKQDLERLIN